MNMERGSITGSYFTVTMPDGTTKQRLKTPLNADPGVHSSLALDQIAQGQLHPVPTLPTITESKVQEINGNGTSSSEQSPPDTVTSTRQRSRNSESDAGDNLTVDKNIPRNASQPVFSSQTSGSLKIFLINVQSKATVASSGIPKNGSVPSFNRSRKTSESGRFQPSLGTIKASSRGDLGSNGDVCIVEKRYSGGSLSSKYSDEFVSRRQIFELF